ncbi:hypothetical protein Tco_0762317, partial [Tanacetum coccineum]
MIVWIHPRAKMNLKKHKLIRRAKIDAAFPLTQENQANDLGFVFEKYTIEVESIPPSQRNSRDVHHHYLNRLRDTLDTLREIVEEARSKRPSDHRLSNVTKARRSQSKNNKMNDKTLPANSVLEKKVEDHHRKNKSKLSKKNRVDSSTSVRRTVFNTNSNSLCKTCLQCPLTRNTKPKVVPVKQWKPTSRLTSLGGQCPLVRPTALTRGTMPADPHGNNTPVEYNLVCSNQQDPNCNWGSIFSNSPDRPLVFGLRLLITYDWRSLTAQEFREE